MSHTQQSNFENDCGRIVSPAEQAAREKIKELNRIKPAVREGWQGAYPEQIETSVGHEVNARMQMQGARDSVNTSKNHDTMTLSLNRKQATTLHCALHELAARFQTCRKAEHVKPAPDTFLINGYTDELDTLHGLLCAVSEFAGRPMPPLFDGREGEGMEAAFLAFADLREPNE